MNNRRKVLELFEEQKDFFNEKVSAGIEANRKGNAAIRLVDEEGKPLANARVKVDQKGHEFRFGANIFMLDELESPEKNAAYKKHFASLFNMATLPFYWESLEPEKGKPRYAADSPKIYRRPAPDLCLEFCEENGIEPREHALAYEAFFPKWLYGADAETTKAEMEKHYAEIAERYANKFRTIEVTNEMFWGTGKTGFYKDPDYVAHSFKLAEKYFPQNQLGINEGTDYAWLEGGKETDRYYKYIADAINKGARIDAVGMQYHLFFKAEEEYEKTRGLLNPENIYNHLDLYSRFGKPLQVTEVTVPAYSWEEEDELIQAEIIEKLYSLWFSHPAVEQIIYWNLVDGYAHLWSSDPQKIKESQGNMAIGENYYHGGLMRFDLSPKPAYFKIKELIQEVWHTRQELIADENGEIRFRGFYGDYEIEVEGKTARFNLSSKKENNETITV